jgi:arylsulfatase A-like enzyme
MSAMRNIAVVVICDSLRRDMMSPELTPAIAALGVAATRFARARGVYPSTTRASSASIATGCRPGRHGIPGNNMVLDEGGRLACHVVAGAAFRERLRAATGRTLRVPTLAQRVREHGGALLVSNASPGATMVHDPDVHGTVLHRTGSFGPGGAALPPGESLDTEKGNDGDAVATTRFCERLDVGTPPAVATLWLSEPDHAGHHHLLGSPAHRAAIAGADRCVAAVAAAVARRRAAGDRVLFVVGSDHGMESIDRRIHVEQALVDAGLKATLDSGDVLVAPNGTSAMISVSGAARARVPALRAFFAAQDWIDCVHAGAELAALHLPVEGHLQLAITMRTRADVNEYGIAGKADVVFDPNSNEGYVGGQHGGLGRHEQAPVLAMQGPGFAAGTVSEADASLIDIAPTILRHLGLPADGMDGRPLQA